MSRSYKHTPYIGFKKSKYHKKLANRKVRHRKTDDLYFFNKSNYKKHYDSYEICDYSEITPFLVYWTDVLKRYNWSKINNYKSQIKEPKPTLKSAKKEWYKYYKRK